MKAKKLFRKMMVSVVGVLVAIGVATTVSSDSPSIEQPVKPQPKGDLVAGIHIWNDYHWARDVKTQKTVLTYRYTELTGLLDPYGTDGIRLPEATLEDWERYTDGTVEFVEAQGADPIDVDITVDDYGMNGWAGLATVNIDGSNHITDSTIQINMYYYTGANSIWFETALRSVFCQEIGHIIGLDHNRPGDSSPDDETCLNDIDIFITPQTTMRPNREDTRSVQKLYNHDDGYVTFSGSPDKTVSYPQKNPVLTITETIPAPPTP